jgi:hypothetical protein
MRTFKIFLHDHFFPILLFIFIGIYIGITYIYLRANTAPPRWDDSMYLEHSEIIFNAFHGYTSYNPNYYNLTVNNQFNLLTLYSHLMAGVHAPLITLLPIPFYFLVGNGFSGLAVTFLILILTFNLILYRFVTYLTDQATAFLAVVITSTMPLTIGLSRYFLVEYGLMSLTTLWVYWQIKSGHFRDSRFNIRMGVILGLGTLMKVIFPLYIIGPILGGFISVLITTKLEKQTLFKVVRNGVIILLIGIVIMGTWYFPNIKQVLAFATDSGFGQRAQNYSLGNPLVIPAIIAYWTSVINIGISAYYFFIFILLLIIQGIVYLFRGKQSGFALTDGSKTSTWIMLLWFVVPLFFFTIGVNKDVRFLLPAISPIGFFISRLMIRLFYPYRLGKFVISLILIFPLGVFLYTSLPLSANSYLKIGPFVAIAPQVGYTTRPVQQEWPLEQMLTKINEDIKKNNPGAINGPIFIGIVPNHEFFNVNNLGYFTALNRLPFSLNHFYPTSDAEWAVQKDGILHQEYLLTKTGNEGPDFAYDSRITPLLLSGELPFHELTRLKLPDGSDGIIYKRSPEE